MNGGTFPCQCAGLLAGGVFLLCASMLPSVAAALDCDGAAAQATALANDLAALEKLRDEATRNCPQPVLKQVEDRLGRAHYTAARDTRNAEERKQHLTTATTMLGSQRWRAHTALGDLYLDEKDYIHAAEQFQLALLQIQEAPDAAAASPDVIRRLIDRANETRSLAPIYTRSVRTRSGEPGGVAAARIGGVEIKEVPFPVEFAFDSAALTERGRMVVADLLDILQTSGVRSIALVGHTDPEGTDDYNEKLSLRRAESVRGELMRLGLKAEVRVRGAGKRSPPEFDDSARYTKPELHQIMRRVVLDRRG